LLAWPVTPGATSYNILRSTTSGTGYAPLTNGVTGPVCGSGPDDATFLDSSAQNSTTYYYVVQSVNPVGSSADSPQSPGVTPSASVAIAPPAAPTGLVAAPGNGMVTLTWDSSSPNANFYMIKRSTVVNNGVGSFVTLGTIILNNTNTGTTYTDTTPSNGSTYNYFVTATSAGGTSTNSSVATATPLPPPPGSAPAGLTATPLPTTNNIILTWLPVSGAIGYLIQRASPSSAGPYNLLASITETNYTDFGINTNSTYFYKVTAVNAAGVSASALASFPAPPIFTSIRLSGSQLLLTGIGGTPNRAYYLLTATDVASAAGQWSRLVTNRLDASGSFALTNTVPPNPTQTFFRLQMQ
jgi:hypothetical protein